MMALSRHCLQQAQNNVCLLVLSADRLIIFANSLEPDQDKQNVCLDLDPNCLTHSDRVPVFV